MNLQASSTQDARRLRSRSCGTRIPPDIGVPVNQTSVSQPMKHSGDPYKTKPRLEKKQESSGAKDTRYQCCLVCSGRACLSHCATNVHFGE